MLTSPTRPDSIVRREGRRGRRSDRALGAPEERSRLAEHFARCFVFALQLRSAEHLGDPEGLRRRATDLVDQAARNARRDGAVVEDVREAEFAVVALLDEAVMSSEWAGKEQWKAAPLQLERYDRFDAGEAFFERLEVLRDRLDGAPALEVYFLCLTLGFKGRYQFLPPDELRRLTEDLQDELLRGRPEHVPLSPHGRPAYVAQATSARVRSTWPLVVGALVLAVALYVLGRVLVGSDAADAVETVERVEPLASAVLLIAPDSP